MYTREWLQTVEEYFRQKNRTWLSGEEDTLLHFMAGTPAACHSWQDVRAMREAIKYRNLQYRKAKTNLQILSVNWLQDQEQAEIEALETVRFYYEQKDQLQYESRLHRRRLLLVPVNGQWRVLQDESVRESLGRDQEKPSLELDVEAINSELGELRGRYDRVRAFKYAELWWNNYNPAYQEMKGNDCTNFISQVLHAGGLPMSGFGNKSRGWWYRNKDWSYSWAVAHSLCMALPSVLKAKQVGDPRLLKVGDVICYDWDGDNRWQHNTVVVDFDINGMPLVNAHTVNSHRRYWDYRDSYAFTPRTQYAFFQIPDQF